MRIERILTGIIVLMIVIWAVLSVLDRFALTSVVYRNLIIVIIDVLILLSGFKFLYKFERRTPKPTEDAWYPPDYFDPAQAGYVMDGFVDDRDIVGLLLMWANMGYLRIRISEGKTYLIRLRKMDRTCLMSYRELFSSIFQNSSGRKQTSELVEKIYPKVAEAKSEVERYFDCPERRLFYLESLALQKGLSILLTVPMLLCVISVYAAQTKIISLNEIIAILIISGMVAVSSMIPVRTLIQILYHWISLPTRDKILKITLIFLYITGFLGLFIVYAYSVYPGLTIFSAAATAALVVMTVFSKRRTHQGAEWLDRLLGLKKFIMEAPPEAISRLVAENPDYYYDVLPYAYVMGVSKEWSERFDEANVNVLPCKWFEVEGMQQVSAGEFHRQIREALGKITWAITSRPEGRVSSGIRH
jgi:hypothetical protein